MERSPVKNILLADDDKNFGLILKKELEEENYAVDLVANGVEAVLSFIDKIYDLVLLDLRMPRLAGIDSLKIIKGLNPDVPAITFSGTAGDAEVAEAKEMGAFECLAKPFSIWELKAHIKNCLSIQKD
jgi:DNA-binding response OmpR family regulator